MREDLNKIICSLIQNIGIVKDDFDLEMASKMAKRISSGIETLKDTWPNLTEEEKKELVSVSLAVKNIYGENGISYK